MGTPYHKVLSRTSKQYRKKQNFLLLAPLLLCPSWGWSFLMEHMNPYFTILHSSKKSLSYCLTLTAQPVIYLKIQGKNVNPFFSSFGLQCHDIAPMLASSTLVNLNTRLKSLSKTIICCCSNSSNSSNMCVWNVCQRLQCTSGDSSVSLVGRQPHQILEAVKWLSGGERGLQKWVSITDPLSTENG